ncbi:hypothetical protein EV379_1423 [Microterricola gilva]|uniref:DUF1648 domain-containing protein n=1 Tax=Microterricola gilva TaxID=393267 RepID=A0A4Q8AM94_9MICO|nr:DUF1648 domain-containing protein [Microterricola gilva]RZU65103.1 hypothetical protein EV379_1423 [Microterricola gilva]
MSNTSTPSFSVTGAEQARVTRSRVILLGIVVPIVLAAAGALLMISWIPELPSPVATHWGADGVNGTGSPWLLAVTPLGITVLFSVFVYLGALRESTPSGLPTVNQKFIAAMGPGLALFLTIGIGGSVATQRGLDSAAAAPDPWLWLVAGGVLGVALAAVVWLVLPRADRSGPEALPVETLEVAATERLFWTGMVSMAPLGLALIGAAVGILIVSAILAAFAGSGVAVLVIAVTLVLFGAAVTTLRWRVSVGGHGLSVVSIAGWPAVRVAIDEVTAARLIDVNPVGDFGGWGWRWAGGRTGIILQGGPAIEVTRRSGRTLVVPVDDAETAVAVLQAAIAQRDA